jgi:hypothetical protein
MIRVFASIRQFAATRGAAALLLAFALNVALVPCAMAIEVVADEHDCCPPELRLEPADCCEFNDGSVQSRGTTFEFDESDELSPGLGHALLVPALSGRNAPVADPPDPPDTRPDLNALFCVYLK